MSGRSLCCRVGQLKAQFGLSLQLAAAIGWIAASWQQDSKAFNSSKGANQVTIVSMKKMLQQASEGRYAVGQFNLNNLEFTQAILQAAQEESAPVILGVSEAYIPYMGGLKVITGMVKALVEESGITVPVALHLDHGSSYVLCIRAIHEGFTSVMIDASHHTLTENMEITRRVTEAAHVLGVSVEAELGRITGREDDLIVDEAEASYAEPEECVRLVRETGIDCLAPALGSVHGPYRGQPKLGFERMSCIQKMTGIPLVLHGGSGLPNEEIRQAISCGTAKINVNTDNQIAFTAAIRNHLNTHGDTYDPRNYLNPARQAVVDSVKAKMRLFGSSGQA
jgi:fructose-bisphosphate aldolase class II